MNLFNTWTLCLAIIMWTVFPVSQQALAANDKWQSNWTVTVGFTNNGEINANLLVEVWQFSQGIYRSRTEPLTCVIPNTVTIASMAATFPGDAAITCDVPSVMDIVHDLTLGQAAISEVCDCKSHVEARATVTFVDEPLELGFPIFYLDGSDAHDLALSAPRTDMGTAVVTHHMEFAVSSSDIVESNPFPIVPGTPQFLEAMLIAPNYVISFFPGPILPQPLFDGKPQTSNGAKTLHIGYSPLTNKFFEGEIHTIHIDPGCVGNDH